MPAYPSPNTATFIEPLHRPHRWRKTRQHRVTSVEATPRYNNQRESARIRGPADDGDARSDDRGAENEGTDHITEIVIEQVHAAERHRDRHADEHERSADSKRARAALADDQHGDRPVDRECEQRMT